MRTNKWLISFKCPIKGTVLFGNWVLDSMKKKHMLSETDVNIAQQEIRDFCKHTYNIRISNRVPVTIVSISPLERFKKHEDGKESKNMEKNDD